MPPETTIVDSGVIVKADIFWNWVIFRETRFFYSLNVVGKGRCATLYRAAPSAQRPEGATLTGLLAFIWL